MTLAQRPTFVSHWTWPRPSQLGASVRPIAETLIQDGAIQLHAKHLAADVDVAAGIHAVIRRVCQIPDLEGGVCAPADAAPLVAYVSRTPRLHRCIDRNRSDEGPAGGFGGLVRIIADFFEPALL